MINNYHVIYLNTLKNQFLAKYYFMKYLIVRNLKILKVQYLTNTANI